MNHRKEERETTSEKLTTKKVLLIVVLILMAYAFIYIGANVSWLAFLPTVGVAILLGIIYWEKREHKPELTTLERVTA